VIELGGGPTELSLVTALFSVGLLAFVLIGGVADRLPQRLVMLAADLIRAAVLIVLGLLSLSGELGIWHLAVGGLLIGAGEAFFIPSYTALLPHLLPEDELLAADAHYHHLQDDIIDGGKFEYEGGSIKVPDGPGLGISLHRDKLDEYAELYKELGGYPYDRDPGYPGRYPWCPSSASRTHTRPWLRRSPPDRPVIPQAQR
jgi:hypothetical protein